MIECQDLGKQFGDFWAVDGISLSVRAGQVLALLGQNGAGKTTTVRMLTSLLKPTRGTASIAGHDVIREPDRVRSSVGVLTEQHGLYLRMTAVEYLDFFGRIYRLDAGNRQRRSRLLLDYFGISEYAARPMGQYSKGMRQKLALARTLLHEPPVLLLDEPTSAMDPESAQLVRQAIAGLRSENRAIIICTHNLVEAEMLADQIAIIYRGHILEQGTMAELKRKLLGPPEYQVRLKAALPLRGWQPPEGASLLVETSSELIFRVSEPEVTNPKIMTDLVGKGASIISMQEVPRTLEEVYLATMKRVADA